MSNVDGVCKVTDKNGRIMVARGGTGKDAKILSGQSKLFIQFKEERDISEHDVIVDLRFEVANTKDWSDYYKKLNARYYRLTFYIDQTKYYVSRTRYNDYPMEAFSRDSGSVKTYIGQSQLIQENGQVSLPFGYISKYPQKQFMSNVADVDPRLTVSLDAMPLLFFVSRELNGASRHDRLDFNQWNDAYLCHNAPTDENFEPVHLHYDGDPVNDKVGVFMFKGKVISPLEESSTNKKPQRLYLCEMRKKLFFVDEHWTKSEYHSDSASKRSKVKVKVNSEDHRLEFYVNDKPYKLKCPEPNIFAPSHAKLSADPKDVTINVLDLTANDKKNIYTPIRDSTVYNRKKQPTYNLLLIASKESDKEPIMQWHPHKPREFFSGDSLAISCHFEDYEGADINKYDGLTVCICKKHEKEAALNDLTQENLLKAGGVFSYNEAFAFEVIESDKCYTALSRGGKTKKILSGVIVSLLIDEQKRAKDESLYFFVNYGDPHITDTEVPTGGKKDKKK